MSITAMAGAGISRYAAGEGTRSHVSGTSEATISAGAARNKRSFVRAAHKRDRAAGRSELRKHMDNWLQSLDAEVAHDAQQILMDSIAEMDHEEFLQMEEREAEWLRIMAEEILEQDPTEYLARKLERELLDEQGGYSHTSGLAMEMAALDMAQTMTLEEAWAEGLRVTRRPSGYTYGRS